MFRPGCVGIAYNIVPGAYERGAEMAENRDWHGLCNIIGRDWPAFPPSSKVLVTVWRNACFEQVVNPGNTALDPQGTPCETPHYPGSLLGFASRHSPGLYRR